MRLFVIVNKAPIYIVNVRFAHPQHTINLIGIKLTKGAKWSGSIYSRFEIKWTIKYQGLRFR